jgi:23S rRNA (cytosine1962-C5)-methyltransferase
VQAAVTVTFGCPKAGFKDPASKKFTGKLVVVNIGFPPDLLPQDRPARTVLQAPAAPVKHKAIKLRGGRFGATRPGHPWIYRRQLLKVDPSIKPGDIVSVISNKGEFLGKGYYNYHSDISIRILTQKNENIDQAFFNDRIKTAAEKRNTLVEHTNAWRAVFSESDGLPGIIVDIYGSTAVLQILTLGMDKRKEFILNAVKDTLKPSYIYEKSASAFRRIESMKDFQAWHGPSGAQFVEIFEGDTKYIVDIVNGHKTGFYLDQRKSRLAISEISRGKSVLDLFCYTGGFAVAAAAGGASQVTAVDIKQQWLELARKNAALNGVAQSVIPVRADAFLFLEEMVRLGKRFDIVIVDPPSFMRNKESLVSARKGYEELNTNAMKVLSDGGTLATFSCSHHMPNEEFAAALKSAAAAAGRTYSILKRCHQDIDHPIARAIPETEYLKGYFLRLGARPKRDTSLL